MKQPPFLAYHVRRTTGKVPAVAVVACTVMAIFPKTRTAEILTAYGTTYANFDDLRTDRRAVADLVAERLIASPAAGESAAVEVAGRVNRAPAAA